MSKIVVKKLCRFFWPFSNLILNDQPSFLVTLVKLIFYLQSCHTSFMFLSIHRKYLLRRVADPDPDDSVGSGYYVEKGSDPF